VAYSRALAGVSGVVTPHEKEGARSAWHLYTVRVPERDALAGHLKARGIGTAIHYPRPIHLQASMAAAGGRPGDLPVSERLSREVLCLPLYPELALENVARVAGEVREFVKAPVRTSAG
jgi:dTDP-4-amino-4,6-dideoxygalactose transaminase